MKRTFKRKGLEVSAMGVGCWAIGGPFWRGDSPVGWGEVDDNESTAMLERAVDLGVTFFDTADVYGAGHSERVVGKALKPYRQNLFIATKFSNVFDEDSRQITGTDTSPEHIRSACEASLKRLDTDYIDLYQLHDGSLLTDKVDGVFDTLDALVTEGKIRAYAWSTDTVAHADYSTQRDNVIAVQHRLNVIEDAPEMLAVIESNDLASINRSPLGMGLLTGKFSADSRFAEKDIRGSNQAWMTYFVDGKPSSIWLGKIASIREILTSEGRTLAQGSLAWLWGRSDNTIPIPGIRTVKQLEENAGAIDKGALSPSQMTEIASILA